MPRQVSWSGFRAISVLGALVGINNPQYHRIMNELTLDALLDLEHAGWRSLCQSKGATFYGKLMTHDAIFILVNGTVMTRGEIADSLDGAPAWESYEITDPQVIQLGADAAVLVYRSTSSRADLPEPFTALMSSTYRLIDGQPRLVLYQQTTDTVGTV